MKLSSNIVYNLKNYYNHQAEKYAQTRRKFWVEKDLLQETFQKYYTRDKNQIGNENDTFRILEFGCGDGRFFREVFSSFIETIFEKNNNITIEYIGVDISQGLLDFAKKNAEEYCKKSKFGKKIVLKFICSDIVEYVNTCKQEYFDGIVGIASFQHIQSFKERLYLMQWFYKILKYDGFVLMVNWSFSHWFIRKYWKAIVGGIWRYLFSFGKQEWNSLFLPRKTGKSNEIFYRFYHIFLLKEFKKLALFSSFVLKKVGYIDGKGRLGVEMKTAKNTFFLVQKSVLN